MPNANQKAKAGIIATRKLLKSERMAGFKATSSALDAIYGNLSTTQAGIGRSQTVANQKTMAALARLAGRTDRSTGRIVQGSERMAANQYGSVIGAAVDRQSGSLEAHAKAANIAVGADAAAGRVGVKGAADVLAITRAGAKEAAAGAAGQLADALAYRAKNDAQIVAGMQQARMEANLQFQTWKRQQDYLKKLEEKDASGKLAGVSTYADAMTSASSGMRVLLEADGTITNADALVAKYNESHGTPLDDNEAAALKVLASKLISNHIYGGQGDRSDEVAAVMDSMHVLYPQWSGQKDKVEKAVTSGLNSVYASAAVSGAEDRQAWLDAHPEGNTAYQKDAAIADALGARTGGTSTEALQQNRGAAIQRAISLGMTPATAEWYVDMLLSTVSAEDLHGYAVDYHPDQLPS